MSHLPFSFRRPSLFFSLLTTAVIAACGGGNGADPAASGSVAASMFTSAALPSESDSTNVESASASVEGSAGMATASSVRRVSLSEIGTALTKAGVDVETTKVGAALVLKNVQATMATSTLLPIVNMLKIPPKVIGYSTDQVQATTEIAPDSDIGAFRTTCDFSHMAFDDPIVFPGQPGKSHLHVFFGNTGANAYSTSASLAGTGNSTCRGGTVNRTAYWVPAIIDTKTGTPIKPDSVGVYYKTGYSGVKPEDVQPAPAGLRMIAGDSSASADSDLSWHFGCDGGSYNNQKYIPDCTLGDDHNLFVIINFPQCWDGVNLDSPDHKSHMAYAQPWIPGCPTDHPVAIPAITYNIWYAIPVGTVLANWRLSSDNYSGRGGYSFHADWFGGWKRDAMESFTKNCMNAKKDCHSHLLGDGRMIY